MSSIIPEQFEPDFRPESYWNCEEALLANVKGEARRRRLADAAAAGNLERIPPMIFRDTLPEPERSLAGLFKRSDMGGEYLPDYRPGEVEIARVALASTTGDVISIRARRRSSSIDYRVVDEYEDQGSEYRLTRAASHRELTFAALVRLIDEVVSEHYESRGLVRHHWSYMYSSCGLATEAADFTTVSSAFYPQLGTYYRHEADEWVRERRFARAVESPDWDERGYGGLYWAIWYGDLDIARQLLDRGDDVDQRAPGAVTPLHLAAFLGDIALARLLLEHGADVNAVDDTGATPLIRTFRNREGTTRLLLEWHARADHAKTSGLTALHAAAAFGDLRTVTLLLSHAGYPASPDRRAITPLHLATTGPVVRSLLAAGANPNARDYDGRTPLHRAVEHRNRDVGFPHVCLSAPHHEDEVATKATLSAPSAPVVRLLIEGGAYVNAADDTGQTALHLARSRHMVEPLIEAGADCDRADHRGNRPLHAAVERCAHGVIRRLLASKAPLDAPNAQGNLPIHTAAAAGDSRTVRALLTGGSPSRVENYWGRTPAMVATEKRRSHIATLIRDWDPVVGLRFDQTGTP